MKFSEYVLDRDNAVAFMEEAVTFSDIPPQISGWNNVTRILDSNIAMYLDPEGLTTTQGK